MVKSSIFYDLCRNTYSPISPWSEILFFDISILNYVNLLVSIDLTKILIPAFSILFLEISRLKEDN